MSDSEEKMFDQAKPILSTMRLNPTIFIDVGKSLKPIVAEGDIDPSEKMKNFHGYNTFSPFVSGGLSKKTGTRTNPGIFNQLLKQFNASFDSIKDSKILVIGLNSDQVVEGVQNIVASVLEGSVNALYRKNIDPSSDSEVMSYEEFDSGMGINIKTQIVDQEFIDEVTDTTSQITVNFNVYTPMLAVTSRPESVLRNLMMIMEENSTDSVKYAIGILMSTKDLENQRVYEIFQFCMENMNVYLPRDMFVDLIDSEAGTDMYNKYVSLASEFPLLSVEKKNELVQEYHIDSIYGESNILFLHKHNKVESAEV
jgi:hypothetical protein